MLNMYITRDLPSKVQEWRDRVYNTTGWIQINSEFNAFWTQIHEEPVIFSILVELDSQSRALEPNPFEEYQQVLSEKLNTLYYILKEQVFKTAKERAIHHYSFLKALQNQKTDISIRFLMKACGRGESGKPHLFVQNYIDPLLRYIYDQLSNKSYILYLLQRYKQRCEWFYQEELRNLYESSGSHQEKVLEKDLNKFLFDQGIDYPFSEPSSPSGKVDVIGLLDTEDPLVLEVKICDREKGYGKDRIISGFRQIVTYSNDYNKPVGYLLVFNMDEAEIDLVTLQNDKSLPARVIFASKIYFIILVNIPPFGTKTASKRGKINKITIHEQELTS